MSLPFHHLPRRSAPAAVNMARDELILTRYGDPAAVRFRAYGWSEPAMTFGRLQSLREAQARAPQEVTLVRRPTAGGVVDHRADFTYALVIPSGHQLSHEASAEVYCALHGAVETALQELGVAAQLAPRSEEGDAMSCFARPSPGDVVDAFGRKLAGAALRRTRDGLLAQGSLDKAAVDAARKPLPYSTAKPIELDWTRFELRLTTALRALLETGRDWQLPTLGINAAEERERAAAYASEGWNARR